jgi:hypothetical protein
MTLFHSHEGRLRGSRSPAASPSQPRSARRLRVLVRLAIRHTGAFLKIIHEAIVTAKTRRVQRELMLHKIPQRPLILDDKWDF